MKRVGFIVNSRVPELRSLSTGMLPHQLVTGWDDAGSPMSFMRFRWVADEVNRSEKLRYELYRPWRRYDAVIFLKSMGVRCEEKLARLKDDGVKTVFEANVDYYTEAPTNNLPGELAPTPAQRRTAIAMTEGADAVIASSTELAKVCARHSCGAKAVPDNIPSSLVPVSYPRACVDGGVLRLWWSGMAAKLYDFLAVSDVLIANAKRIRLEFVTGDVAEAKKKWPVDVARKLEDMLRVVPHAIHRFRGIPELMKLYSSSGGAIVSPRYLDSPYNRSHTEWKLTLGLACGLPGIGSPQPSYKEAAAAAPCALSICSSNEEWSAAIDSICRNPEAARERGIEGRNCIMKAYGTPQVAARHASVLEKLLS